MNPVDPLALFLPPVQAWFRQALGEPTPVQRQGWPVIAAGKNALLLAPTGSGKTLAAFLACLDGLWRQPIGSPRPRTRGRGAGGEGEANAGKIATPSLQAPALDDGDGPTAPGVQVLYISPLKALNNDIYRNLQVPLEGVADAARRMNIELPAIDIAVRTGDTPTAERARLLRKPPHVLITTPESLHILLTSKAREVLRNVTHCIVDEIHALCPNKRGVFLSLLLERLEAINRRSFVRIGLSATQRPLEEVARFLGGLDAPRPRTRGRGDGGEGAEPSENSRLRERFCPPSPRPSPPGVPGGEGEKLESRPVTIVDAGLRKNLDLKVISPLEQYGAVPEKSIWPSIYRLLARLIEQHHSTLIFANNRRTVERITAAVNEVFEAEEHDSSDFQPASQMEMKASAPQVVRAHHGSVSLEVRRQTEEALKEGRLRAVAATASLELGIDMGAVDLVCQVSSTGNVARALQRVGRAGHLVEQESKGRLIPLTTADLLDEAVLAAEMAAGRVEALRVPVNCLDVLAQQVVAMVAMEDWSVPDLFALVRRAYPFRELTAHALDSVLEMVSGRFRFSALEESQQSGGRRANPTPQLTALQPRISWDRVHNRLHALPGSQRLAIMNGGTIPDTGQYAVVTVQGLRVGEVDEEFVYERRVGDAFLLGTTSWRIEGIDADRVLVVPAEGAPGMVPFWRGETTGRSFDLGLAQGCFLAELMRRLDDPDLNTWLQRAHFLDAAAAANLRDYVRRQLLRTGVVPTDRTIYIEASRDPLGDWQVLLLSPLGSRFHLGLRLALENLLRRRLGYRPHCLHHDNGLLIRLTESEEPVLDLLDGLTPENLRDLVLEELADSTLFALRFRHNAARALLMPRGAAHQRAPLWLQRLRGRDLLQVARRHPDFPIIAETFRECLHDHLDLPQLEGWLRDIQKGEIKVKTARLDAPSPFAASLLFSFTMANMYVYDVIDADPSQTTARLDPHLLDQLIGHSDRGLPLDPRAIHQVESRLRGVGQPPRSAAEMAEWLRRLGDVTDAELEGPMAEWLAELEQDGRALRLVLPRVETPERWVLAEEAETYRLAFLAPSVAPEAQRDAASGILLRFLNTHALVGLTDLLRRYPLEESWARRQLETWAKSGRAILVHRPQAPDALEWSAPVNFQHMQRGTLAILRNEVVPCPAPQYADFLVNWQRAYPSTRKGGPEGLQDTLLQLQNVPLAAEIWENAVLPARVGDYQPRWLDELTASGQWLWRSRGGPEAGPGSVEFLARVSLPQVAPPGVADNLADEARAVQQTLQQRGASFVPDLAQVVGFSPSAVRTALWELVRRGLATNDQFEVVRRGETLPDSAPPANGRLPTRSMMRQTRPRRRAPERPEGRWSLIPWSRPDVETQTIQYAQLLLQRYGIVARELAALEEAAPPWRILYEVLSRLEWTGDIRRGYFVEGLSGAQFALPEAVRQLQDRTLPAAAQEPAILLHSLDPANLYGSGAPFDIPLLAGGARPFLRRAGNWLVLKAGRPVLLIEQHGKRLTSLASADRQALAEAVACVPRLGKQALGHKLSVETWNEEPVTTSAGRVLLEGAGFVRDYQALTLWR